jgi:hypothetical protein
MRSKGGQAGYHSSPYRARLALQPSADMRVPPTSDVHQEGRTWAARLALKVLGMVAPEPPGRFTLAWLARLDCSQRKYIQDESMPGGIGGRSCLGVRYKVSIHV